MQRRANLSPRRLQLTLSGIIPRERHFGTVIFCYRPEKTDAQKREDLAQGHRAHK